MTEGGQDTRRARVGIIVVVALLALVAAAWALEALLTDPDDVAPVVVVRGDETLASFSIDQLRELPQTTVQQLGKVQEGPAVRDVLAAAGITDFDHLIVRGLGVRDSGRIELAAEQVTADTVLDFANRGTVKITGPNITWDARVRDVTVLEVQ